MPEQCDCCTKTMIVLSCSGASDVGELADRAARMLSQKTKIKMGCLAGIGGNISGFIASANGADIVIAIDGCSVSCAKKTLETHGIKKFNHLKVTDCGFEKGDALVTKKNIERIFRYAKKLI
ncbi:MAG: putative zinc-binding protein [Elusimicrobiota bacterium]